MTGLSGTGFALQHNGGDTLSFTGSGSFVFGTRLDNSAAYSVTVQTPPSNPSQTCTVRNGSGTIDKASVTNVIVSCTQVGRFAYIANRQSNSISVFGIDPATGRLVPLNGSPLPRTARHPRRSPSIPMGSFYTSRTAAPMTCSMYSIDDTSGALTATGFPIATGSGPAQLSSTPPTIISMSPTWAPITSRRSHTKRHVDAGGRLAVRRRRGTGRTERRSRRQFSLRCEFQRQPVSPYF